MKNNKIELSDISKNNPFKVPENYFENFYDNFEKRLNVKPKKSKIYYLRFAIAVAASLILVFMLIKPLNLSDSKIVKIEKTDSISIEDYIGISSDDVYYTMTEPTTETSLNPDDVVNYIATTSSDYEIYMELNK
jgi:hypothetical protein